jgi:micrococcal nuclease
VAGGAASKSRYPAAMARTRAVVVATVAAASVLGASVLGWWLGGLARAAQPVARVVEVIDGDTVVVEFADHSTDTVRLLGIDTPETKHPVKGVECFGPEASAFTTEHLLGRVVRLESDVVRRDVYDRRLAYVTVRDSRFNDVLVSRGYARFLVIPPNDLHARDLLVEELDARRHRRGLWGAC